MKIEFDPSKDSGNQKKHGVSLSLAREFDWEAALVWVDNRFEYEEVRMIALVPKDETLYYVAFVMRNEAQRIISLRRANRREVKYYAKNFSL
ncbi:MAG: BrnT family toxin [Patescibacteria group bacterium]